MQLFSDPFSLGILASLLAGTATGLGALPIFFKKDFSRRSLDVMLGFAAGIMLAASAFSLLVPAFDHINTPEWLAIAPGWAIGAAGIVTVVGSGFLLGGLFVHIAEKYLPHEHFEKGREGPASRLARVWLLVIAIAIHNFPEGLAVGVSFGVENVATGVSVAVAIALQNIPEGLAVAAPLVREGYSRKYAALLALSTGLVEPLGGILGVSVITVAIGLLPYGLAFAAGAMVFVVGDEMVPESHAGGNARIATWGLMIGFFIMMTLDNIFPFLFPSG
ncbi:MAG: ZIP family metal transporter [Candidatus Thorarchaeota archaeon]|jgi:ZIP family zinc transporter